MEATGFILLRCVIDELTNQYWNHSYESIRKYYPENSIMIIDDNSNYTYINERILYKTTIINSEYPSRGELLPYYYYLHNKLFDIAVIINDSVFINIYIDFKVDKFKFIWYFEHYFDQIEDETRLINLFNNTELLDYYNNKNLWKGCFGSMSIITHEYLIYINNKFDISILLDHILTRYNRCSFERIIGCLLQYNDCKICNEYNTWKKCYECNKKRISTLLGNIFDYCNYGCINFTTKDYHNNLPIIKVWTGR
jgi:uncharacterized protein YutD